MRALLFVVALAGCATARDGRATYAEVNGLRMYYEEHGRGHPLLLLHGGGSTVQTSFGQVLPQLARKHRVIAPEQQGHGHTADIQRPLSFEQMADDTATLLRQLDLRDVDVMGFSNGGMVGLQLAIRHPELVRRLVVCSGFYAHEGLVRALREGFQNASAADMPKALREAYLAAAPHPDLDSFVAETVAMMQSFSDIPDAALRRMRAPTLVMVGDTDVVTVEHAAQLSRLVPHGQLTVLPGSEHGAYLGVAEAAKPTGPLRAASLALIEAFLDGR